MSPNVACTKSADDTSEMTQMIITPQMGNICNPSGHKDGNPPPVFHTNISSAKALPALRCAKFRHLRKLLIGSRHFPSTSESCTRFIESAPGQTVSVESGQPLRLGYRSKQSFGWCGTPTETLSLGSLQTSTSMTK